MGAGARRRDDTTAVHDDGVEPHPGVLAERRNRFEVENLSVAGADEWIAEENCQRFAGIGVDRATVDQGEVRGAPVDPAGAENGVGVDQGLAGRRRVTRADDVVPTGRQDHLAAAGERYSAARSVEQEFCSAAAAAALKIDGACVDDVGGEDQRSAVADIDTAGIDQ
jgi:hypothetical protein